MKLLLIYAAGFFVMISWSAWKDSMTVDLRAAYFVALLWPLVLAVVPVFLALDLLSKRGWMVDVGKPPGHLKGWGTRKAPTWDRSWAIRCPWLELQVWYAPVRDRRAARHAANVAAVRGNKPK